MGSTSLCFSLQGITRLNQSSNSLSNKLSLLLVAFGLSSISFDKIPQNRAQISNPNDMNDPNDIIRPSQDSTITKDYSCYYCNDFQTSIKYDYGRHVILKHPKKRAYPTKQEIEALGLKAQGKGWGI